MADTSRTILTVEGLSVSYGRDHILQDLSFSLNEGDVLVILGPNGAGKTTLLRALLDLIPHRGTVTWQTRNISYLPPQEFLQRQALPPLSVEEFFHLKTRDRDAIVVFSTSLAVAFLFLPQKETEIALLGDVSQITLSTVLVTLAIAGGIFIVVKRIYPNMVLIGISPDLAQSQQIDPRRYNTVYLICIALTVALGVRIVGGLMTAALLAIPACTAKNISKNLTQYAYFSLSAGALAAVLGIAGYAATDVPPGPLIIIASGLLFLVSVYLKMRQKGHDGETEPPTEPE
ncbi:metal ABC transporter permease [Methylohalobius crimeensis]|uniref:metal ABC transporter permease n=1 Tax=Methylohalobius crimeensis TaxID=244365 RepID=UPI0003B51789|nr:metal ABC transporter permease [Methylohalobius crimeensis]